VTDCYPADKRLLSFKEIDALHHCPKGTAFRAFKRLGARLTEGEHFYYLDAQHCSADIDALRQAGRIYASTINAVLVTAAGYRLIAEVLGQPPRL